MAMSSLNARLDRTAAPGQATESAPPGLSVSRETADGDPIVNIVVSVPRYRRWLSGAILGLPSLLMLFSLGDSDLWFIALFCLAFVLSALLVLVPDWRTTREIDITRAYITFSDAVAGSGGSSETIPTPSIRSVGLVRARRNVGYELLVSSEDTELRFGAGLPRDSLAWLGDTLMGAVRSA